MNSFLFVYLLSKNLIIMSVPKHEEFKRGLLSKFEHNKNYSGKDIRSKIEQTDFRELVTVSRPSYIKREDGFISFFGVKSRPCVVLKVLKDRTVIYTTLTSTENVHCLCTYKSRFFGEGCFSKVLSVCTEEFALEKFVSIFDSPADVNKAVKLLKNYFINSL